MIDSNIFITGANGQLGTALREKYPNSKYADVGEMDITKKESIFDYDWSGIKYIINAAAYTKVDGAETEEGRVASWAVNASAVSYLAQVANKNNITLVHISSDYVFDGTIKIHNEQEQFSPLSVYGATKAAGDIACSLANKYYILRTSWVIGEGNNFVRTMLDLAKKGIDPTVVDDQTGRLTFTSEIVRAVDFLLANNSKYGTYNVTNCGESLSWAGIAKEIYRLGGFENKVTGIATAEYYKDREGIAPRPLNSTLELSKISSLGFESIDWPEDLKKYIKKEMKQ